MEGHYRYFYPWLGGDFNVVRFPNERKEGYSISPSMRDFNNWIRSRDLCNFPLRGAEFTWSNLQECPVMSRLDRFLVSTEWLDLFPDCTQRALAWPTSDHCPLMLETGMEDWVLYLLNLKLLGFQKRDSSKLLENGGPQYLLVVGWGIN